VRRLPYLLQIDYCSCLIIADMVVIIVIAVVIQMGYIKVVFAKLGTIIAIRMGAAVGIAIAVVFPLLNNSYQKFFVLDD
jgi:hypothetical protein